MFDINQFKTAKFERRTEAVIVKGLQEFFPDGEKAEFIVQGLKHSEVAKCAEGIQSNDNLKAVLQAAAGHAPSIKEAINDIIGGKDEIPKDTQKRILHLVVGSVEPKIDEAFAVRLSETFPVEFIELTTKILELTGLGQVAIKKQ